MNDRIKAISSISSYSQKLLDDLKLKIIYHLYFPSTNFSTVILNYIY